MVDGGAGSIAQRVADELGDAVRLNAPVRSITQHDDRVVVDDRRRSRCRRAHAVVAVPPALALEIAFDPVLPDDRLTLYRNAVGGPGDEDARRLRRAVLARRRLQRPDRPSRGSAAEVTLDASPGVGHARRHRVVHVRAGRRTRRRARSRRAPRARVLDALDRAARAARRVAGRVHRDRVVEGGVDARLLDGALPARASSRATDRCSASRSAACTGPAPRRRRCRTARSTAPSAPASAPRPRSSTARSADQARAQLRVART